MDLSPVDTLQTVGVHALLTADIRQVPQSVITNHLPTSLNTKDSNYYYDLSNHPVTPLYYQPTDLDISTMFIPVNTPPNPFPPLNDSTTSENLFTSSRVNPIPKNPHPRQFQCIICCEYFSISHISTLLTNSGSINFRDIPEIAIHHEYHVNFENSYPDPQKPSKHLVLQSAPDTQLLGFYIQSTQSQYDILFKSCISCSLLFKDQKLSPSDENISENEKLAILRHIRSHHTNTILTTFDPPNNSALNDETLYNNHCEKNIEIYSALVSLKKPVLVSFSSRNKSDILSSKYFPKRLQKSQKFQKLSLNKPPSQESDIHLAHPDEVPADQKTLTQNSINLAVPKPLGKQITSQTPLTNINHEQLDLPKDSKQYTLNPSHLKYYAVWNLSVNDMFTYTQAHNEYLCKICPWHTDAPEGGPTESLSTIDKLVDHHKYHHAFEQFYLFEHSMTSAGLYIHDKAAQTCLVHKTCLSCQLYFPHALNKGNTPKYVQHLVQHIYDVHDQVCPATTSLKYHIEMNRKLYQNTFHCQHVTYNAASLSLIRKSPIFPGSFSDNPSTADNIPCTSRSPLHKQIFKWTYDEMKPQATKKYAYTNPMTLTTSHNEDRPDSLDTNIDLEVDRNQYTTNPSHSKYYAVWKILVNDLFTYNKDTHDYDCNICPWYIAAPKGPQPDNLSTIDDLANHHKQHHAFEQFYLYEHSSDSVGIYIADRKSQTTLIKGTCVSCQLYFGNFANSSSFSPSSYPQLMQHIYDVHEAESDQNNDVDLLKYQFGMNSKLYRNFFQHQQVTYNSRSFDMVRKHGKTYYPGSTLHGDHNPPLSNTKPHGAQTPPKNHTFGWTNYQNNDKGNTKKPAGKLTSKSKWTESSLVDNDDINGFDQELRRQIEQIESVYNAKGDVIQSKNNVLTQHSPDKPTLKALARERIFLKLKSHDKNHAHQKSTQQMIKIDQSIQDNEHSTDDLSNLGTLSDSLNINNFISDDDNASNQLTQQQIDAIIPPKHQNFFSKLVNNNLNFSDSGEFQSFFGTLFTPDMVNYLHSFFTIDGVNPGDDEYVNARLEQTDYLHYVSESQQKKAMKNTFITQYNQLIDITREINKLHIEQRQLLSSNLLFSHHALADLPPKLKPSEIDENQAEDIHNTMFHHSMSNININQLQDKNIELDFFHQLEPQSVFDWCEFDVSDDDVISDDDAILNDDVFPTNWNEYSEAIAQTSNSTHISFDFIDLFIEVSGDTDQHAFSENCALVHPHFANTPPYQNLTFSKLTTYLINSNTASLFAQVDYETPFFELYRFISERVHKQAILRTHSSREDPSYIRKMHSMANNSENHDDDEIESLISQHFLDFNSDFYDITGSIQDKVKMCEQSVVYAPLFNASYHLHLLQFIHNSYNRYNIFIQRYSPPQDKTITSLSILPSNFPQKLSYFIEDIPNYQHYSRIFHQINNNVDTDINQISTNWVMYASALSRYNHYIDSVTTKNGVKKPHKFFEMDVDDLKTSSQELARVSVASLFEEHFFSIWLLLTQRDYGFNFKTMLLDQNSIDTLCLSNFGNSKLPTASVANFILFDMQMDALDESSKFKQISSIFFKDPLTAFSFAPLATTNHIDTAHSPQKTPSEGQFTQLKSYTSRLTVLNESIHRLQQKYDQLKATFQSTFITASSQDHRSILTFLNHFMHTYGLQVDFGIFNSSKAFTTHPPHDIPCTYLNQCIQNDPNKIISVGDDGTIFYEWDMNRLIESANESSTAMIDDIQNAENHDNYSFSAGAVQLDELHSFIKDNQTLERLISDEAKRKLQNMNQTKKITTQNDFDQFSQGDTIMLHLDFITSILNGKFLLPSEKIIDIATDSSAYNDMMVFGGNIPFQTEYNHNTSKMLSTLQQITHPADNPLNSPFVNQINSFLTNKKDLPSKQYQTLFLSFFEMFLEAAGNYSSTISHKDNTLKNYQNQYNIARIACFNVISQEFGLNLIEFYQNTANNDCFLDDLTEFITTGLRYRSELCTSPHNQSIHSDHFTEFPQIHRNFQFLKDFMDSQIQLRNLQSNFGFSNVNDLNKNDEIKFKIILIKLQITPQLIDILNIVDFSIVNKHFLDYCPHDKVFTSLELAQRETLLQQKSLLLNQINQHLKTSTISMDPFDTSLQTNLQYSFDARIIPIVPHSNQNLTQYAFYDINTNTTELHPTNYITHANYDLPLYADNPSSYKSINTIHFIDKATETVTTASKIATNNTQPIQTSADNTQSESIRKKRVVKKIIKKPKIGPSTPINYHKLFNQIEHIPILSRIFPSLLLQPIQTPTPVGTKKTSVHSKSISHQFPMYFAHLIASANSINHARYRNLLYNHEFVQRLLHLNSKHNLEFYQSGSFSTQHQHITSIPVLQETTAEVLSTSRKSLRPRTELDVSTNRKNEKLLRNRKYHDDELVSLDMHAKCPVGGLAISQEQIKSPFSLMTLNEFVSKTLPPSLINQCTYSSSDINRQYSGIFNVLLHATHSYTSVLTSSSDFKKLQRIFFHPHRNLQYKDDDADETLDEDNSLTDGIEQESKIPKLTSTAQALLPSDLSFVNPSHSNTKMSVEQYLAHTFNTKDNDSDQDSFPEEYEYYQGMDWVAKLQTHASYSDTKSLLRPNPKLNKNTYLLNNYHNILPKWQYLETIYRALSSFITKVTMNTQITPQTPSSIIPVKDRSTLFQYQQQYIQSTKYVANNIAIILHHSLFIKLVALPLILGTFHANRITTDAINQETLIKACYIGDNSDESIIPEIYSKLTNIAKSCTNYQLTENLKILLNKQTNEKTLSMYDDNEDDRYYDVPTTTPVSLTPQSNHFQQLPNLTLAEYPHELMSSYYITFHGPSTAQINEETSLKMFKFHHTYKFFQRYFKFLAYYFNINNFTVLGDGSRSHDTTYTHHPLNSNHILYNHHKHPTQMNIDINAQYPLITQVFRADINYNLSRFDNINSLNDFYINLYYNEYNHNFIPTSHSIRPDFENNFRARLSCSGKLDESPILHGDLLLPSQQTTALIKFPAFIFFETPLLQLQYCYHAIYDMNHNIMNKLNPLITKQFCKEQNKPSTNAMISSSFDNVTQSPARIQPLDDLNHSIQHNYQILDIIYNNIKTLTTQLNQTITSFLDLYNEHYSINANLFSVPPSFIGFRLFNFPHTDESRPDFAQLPHQLKNVLHILLHISTFYTTLHSMYENIMLLFIDPNSIHHQGDTANPITTIFTFYQQLSFIVKQQTTSSSTIENNQFILLFKTIATVNYFAQLYCILHYKQHLYVQNSLPLTGLSTITNQFYHQLKSSAYNGYLSPANTNAMNAIIFDPIVMYHFIAHSDIDIVLSLVDQIASTTQQPTPRTQNEQFSQNAHKLLLYSYFSHINGHITKSYPQKSNKKHRMINNSRMFHQYYYNIFNISFFVKLRHFIVYEHAMSAIHTYNDSATKPSEMEVYFTHQQISDCVSSLMKDNYNDQVITQFGSFHTSFMNLLKTETSSITLQTARNPILPHLSNSQFCSELDQNTLDSQKLPSEQLFDVVSALNSHEMMLLLQNITTNVNYFMSGSFLYYRASIPQILPNIPTKITSSINTFLPSRPTSPILNKNISLNQDLVSQLDSVRCFTTTTEIENFSINEFNTSDGMSSFFGIYDNHLSKRPLPLRNKIARPPLKNHLKFTDLIEKRQYSKSIIPLPITRALKIKGISKPQIKCPQPPTNVPDIEKLPTIVKIPLDHHMTDGNEDNKDNIIPEPSNSLNIDATYQNSHLNQQMEQYSFIHFSKNDLDDHHDDDGDDDDVDENENLGIFLQNTTDTECSFLHQPATPTTPFPLNLFYRGNTNKQSSFLQTHLPPASSAHSSHLFGSIFQKNCQNSPNQAQSYRQSQMMSLGKHVYSHLNNNEDDNTENQHFCNLTTDADRVSFASKTIANRINPFAPLSHPRD